MKKHSTRAAACLLALLLTTQAGPLALNALAEDSPESQGFRFYDDGSVPEPEKPGIVFHDGSGESKPKEQETAPEPQAPPLAQPSKENAEIERKFVIDPARLPANMKQISRIYEIEQTYINYSPEIRVRKLNNGAQYTFALKRPADKIGLSREEITFSITKEEYEELVKKKVGNTVYKTRYQFHENGVYIFVDVYKGGLEGLVVAEVEFESTAAAEQFTPPEWFGKDVTSDKRYKNANLAKDGMPKDE